MAKQKKDSSPPVGISVAAIIEKNDRLLCVRQAGIADAKWSIPAGHLEPGEMILSGLKREIKEETGYDIMPFELLGIYNRSKKDGTRVAFVFVACVTGGGEIDRSEEIMEIKWFSEEEIKKLIAAQEFYRPEYSIRVFEDWIGGITHSIDVFKEI